MNDTIQILIKARKEKEITLKELSERSGVSLGTVNKLFSGGIASVKVSTANKLAKALGLTPEDLISNSLISNQTQKTASSCNHGFVKCAALTNEIRVGDVNFNTQKTLDLINDAVKQGVSVAVFPELNLTSYTAFDLLQQDVLLNSVIKALEFLLRETALKEILFFVGAPIRVKGRIFNCAVAICKGKILAVIPKTNLPNYNEFGEKRQFAPAPDGISEITLCGQTVNFGTKIILSNNLMPEMQVACEICEDIWVPNPPSIGHCLNGAVIIANLSASPEILGKKVHRRQIVNAHTSKCLCAYVYTSSGFGESTTDGVFGAHNIISEAGKQLQESAPFGDGLAIADVDCGYLQYERSKKFNSYKTDEGYEWVPFDLVVCGNLKRTFSKTPFIPEDGLIRDDRCESALTIQSHALYKRICHVNAKKLVIGVSGGLDSTLAILVAVRALKLAGRKASDLVAITMPCFGTSNRTLTNAKKLCAELKCEFLQIDLSQSVKGHLSDIGHDGMTADVTFENAQARERTQVLMDYANKVGGLVIGTGDLSELALGWATYNGDHMSMYSVNCGVSKTLTKEIVLYVGKNSGEKLKNVLFDIADTPISPELTPLENGEIKQSTENIIGPYILHDFFLYNMLRRGYSPSKLYYVAKHTFVGEYSKEEIAKWLTLFLKRFFTQQFKRSCLPDGPKVSSVSLSPRSGFKMSSDVTYSEWLNELERALAEDN